MAKDKDICAKIKKLEDELSALPEKIEKNNLIIQESEETVSRLQRKTHDIELDLILHSSKENADLLQVLKDHRCEAEQMLEDSRLRSEAFLKEKNKLEIDLATARKELSDAELKQMAGKAKGLVSTYNISITQAFKAGSALKMILEEMRKRGNFSALSELDPDISKVVREMPVPCFFLGEPTAQSFKVTTLSKADRENILKELMS